MVYPSTKEIAMTKTAPAQMPQRYNWDVVDYCTVDSVPHPTGYWVDADDVEPLVDEINRLRARVQVLEREVERLEQKSEKDWKWISDATGM
jgi:hypothetical protein